VAATGAEVVRLRWLEDHGPALTEALNSSRVG